MIGGDGINDESNKTAPAPTRNTDLTKYTGARYQRCMVHFGRNVLARVDTGNRDWEADALKAVWIGNGVLD